VGNKCIDECYKIKMILDKDMLAFQYAECIQETCRMCRILELRAIAASGQSDGYLKKWAEDELKKIDTENTIRV
jgi:hypothetical protein